MWGRMFCAARYLKLIGCDQEGGVGTTTEDNTQGDRAPAKTKCDASFLMPSQLRRSYQGETCFHQITGKSLTHCVMSCVTVCF